MRLDHRERLIRQIVREVIPVGISIDGHRSVVAHQPVRVVEVRKRIEDAVERVEPALAGPGVLGAPVVAFAVLGEMPLAHHHRVIAVVAKDLGHRRRVLREL